MRTMKTLITPSILSADLGRLQEEVDSVSTADWIQVDVMDGHFVPNLTFGAPVLACIKTTLLLDIHLMVSNPADRVAEFLKVGAKNITFHAEAVKSTEKRKAIIHAIKSGGTSDVSDRAGGATAGIAINPATPVSEIADVISDVDLVLIMSVNPGFSGQSFMEEVLEKVKELRSAFPTLMIQMDGGIDAITAPLCTKAGADNLVAASYIFKATDRAKAISTLRLA